MEELLLDRKERRISRAFEAHKSVWDFFITAQRRRKKKETEESKVIFSFCNEFMTHLATPKPRSSSSSSPITSSYSKGDAPAL